MRQLNESTNPSICSLLQTILQTLYPTTLKILRNVHKYTIIIYVVIYTHSDNRSVNKVRSVISNNVINKNSISLPIWKEWEIRGNHEFFEVSKGLSLLLTLGFCHYGSCTIPKQNPRILAHLGLVENGTCMHGF